MCFGEKLAECSVIYVLVRRRNDVGEGTLGVDELVGDRVVGLITFEEVGDVVGVEALLGEWRRLFSTESQVAEVGLQVRVHQDREEDE